MKEEMMNGGEFRLAAGKIVEQSIMEDILLRLPVKSLIRFKSVCKTWRSLISNTHFARAHLTRRTLENPNSSQRLLLTIGKPHEFALKSFNYEESNFEEEVAQDLLDCPGRFSLPPSLSIVSIRFHGSCDGLVCLYYDIGCSGNSNHTIVIWNPTTGEFKQIPSPTSFSSSPFWIVGFGYDPGSDDYKILSVFGGGGRELMIFSLKKDKLWRSLEKCHDYTPSGGGVYLNGYFHWLATNIWSFDLSDEKFKVNIPLLPKDIDDGGVYASLAVLGGCLFVYAGNCEVERSSRCWILSKGGKLWKELSELRCYQGRECLKYAVGCTSDGKVLFHLFDDYKSYGREKHFLCLYSAPDNSSRLASFDNLISPQMYVESLVSPSPLI